MAVAVPPGAADGVAVVEIDVDARGVTPSDPPWVDWVAGGCLAECYAEDEVDPNGVQDRGSHVAVGLLADLVVLVAQLLVEAEEEDGGEGAPGDVAQVFAAASFVGEVDGQVVVVVGEVAPMGG